MHWFNIVINLGLFMSFMGPKCKSFRYITATVRTSFSTYGSKRDTSTRDIKLLFEKILDTTEDAILHLRRYFLPYYKSHQDITSELEKYPSAINPKPRVVLIGSGWAAHAFLKVCETDAYDVVCISPRPYFVFTPMLAATAVGTVEQRSIVESIRISNPSVTYFEAEMLDLNPLEKSITICSSLRPNETLSVSFDYLVYSAGAIVNDFGLRGVKEHCYFIKELDDVRNIKRKVLENFEKASLPRTPYSEITRLLSFAIVGGGPTGVEFVGELSDFVSNELKQLYPALAPNVVVTLVSSGSSILNAFDSVLQERAMESLRRRGVRLLLNSSVVEVDYDKLTLRRKGSDVVEQLPQGLCVWAAGTNARPITIKVAEACGEEQIQSVKTTGRLTVDRWLRVVGIPQTTFGSILAMGDAALVRDSEEGNLPQTAQVAAQQGAYVARLFNRRYGLSSLPAPSIPSSSELLRQMSEDQKSSTPSDDVKLMLYRSSTGLQVDDWSFWDWQLVWAGMFLRARGALQAEPFKFLNFGLLAYIGGSEAVAQVQLGEADFIKAAGGNAFILWRSVYLVKQVSTRTRFLVLADFIKSKLFGRDLTSV